METIHCKVSFENEIRRFQWNVTETYQNLQQQIKSIFGLTEGCVTTLNMKYKDDEGDIIILESDEELKCAIDHSDGLLRLFVERGVVSSTTTTAVDELTVTSTGSTCHVCNHHGSGRGRGGRGSCHRGGRRGNCGGQRGARNKQQKIDRLTSKRDSLLSDLKNASVSSDEVKSQRLQSKLERIEKRLQWLNSVRTEESSDTTTTIPTTTTSTTAPDEVEEGKKCKGGKRERKSEKYRHCHQRRNHHLHEEDQQRKRCARKKDISSETLAQIAVLKAQMRELKPSLNAVKGNIRDKKRQLATLKEQSAQTSSTISVPSSSDSMKVDEQSSQKIEQLKKEIGELNDIKKEYVKAIVPLKTQIRALKYEQQ